MRSQVKKIGGLASTMSCRIVPIMASDEINVEVVPHMIAGNEFILLPGGAQRLKALIRLIEGARTRLDLYYYVFANDICGQRVADALLDARNRDVSVTLMVDAFGSANTPQSFFDPMIDAGVRFAWFGARRSTRYLIRNHQKMAIADGRRALIGGFNCEQHYFGDEGDPASWCDLGLLIKGPLAADLERWYHALAQWTIETKQRFWYLRRLVRIWKPGDGAARWLIGGPIRRPLSSWVRQLNADLHAANRLDLVAAYFSPNPGVMRRIGVIARRGSVRLLMAMKSDNKATIGASRHLYKRLLRAGTSIFEFRPQKLHMKLIVVDDVTYVGSANFDMRSLYINLELMLRIDNAAFATEARGLIDRMAKRSRDIDKSTYARMAGPLRRLIWRFDYLLVGVLDYTVTRRLNFRRQRR